MGRHAAAFSSEPTARARRPDAKTSTAAALFKEIRCQRHTKSSMADLPDIFADSDSADSENPFDVEIEKYEKQLQLARYRKKYRNAWPYITNRWQDAHIKLSPISASSNIASTFPLLQTASFIYFITLL